jgi:hypothetical protein
MMLFASLSPEERAVPEGATKGLKSSCGVRHSTPRHRVIPIEQIGTLANLRFGWGAIVCTASKERTQLTTASG